MCAATSIKLPETFIFNKNCTITRCPELLMGKNSVRPCKVPMIKASK